MKTIDQLTREEIIVALNKDWMTHDGMWFFNSVMQLGIEKTNQLNLSAIEGMTQVEIHRFKKLLGFNKERIESFEEFKAFFEAFHELFIPDFMGSHVEFTDRDSVIVGMEKDNCFAYKGIKKMNQLDEYLCGVLYRIEIMFKLTGLRFKASHTAGKCLMHYEGACQVEYQLDFSEG